MHYSIGVIMDPIASISPKKDTTLAMMLEIQRRGWTLYYLEMPDLYLRDGEACGQMRPVNVQDDVQDWFSLGDPIEQPLASLDCVLMRKDPPFDMEYVYSTYILERASLSGTLVVNRPDSLRDVNEKAFISWFPQCCAPTLISRDRTRLKNFLSEHQEIVVKPLDGMGGSSVFRLNIQEANVNVILETLTQYDQRFIMAQKFIPQISSGDKRILVINGQPFDYALARIPSAGESRGNLAAGGSGKGQPLSERDRWIVEQISPTLIERGLLFVGLDVIGDYLTEINVTSPTCVRELDMQYEANISGLLMDAIAEKLARR